MWCIIRHYRALTKQSSFHKEIKRLFLSQSFSCDDSWSKRLKSPILQKVSLEDLYYELDNKFVQTKKTSAIDIDIFVNTVNSDQHVDEMEDLVHRFRLSSEAANILDSTHHAFIRNYLIYGNSNELMRILNDRLNYGIFPDNFCSLLMMNYFIKKEDYRNAAKVATLRMLQEDFSHELINYLCLYSCHKYLLNPEEWDKKADLITEDDGEEVRVRVKYIRNPFDDEHFDLKDPNKLIGKTLYMISCSINDPYRDSYKLLGLVLFNKLKEAEDLITQCLKSNKSLHKGVIDLVESVLNQNDNNDYSVNNVKTSLGLLEKQFVNEDVLHVLEEKIRCIVAAKELLIIQEQTQIYEDWENVRETALKNELKELHKIAKLEEIEKTKNELHEKEEELFFFDKENELELKVDNKKVRYPKKWLGKKKKKRNVDEDYIPPEITKKWLGKKKKKRNVDEDYIPPEITKKYSKSR